MFFALETGCRPNEAAYLVLNNSFRRISSLENCDYLAIVPPSAAKTRIRYKWAMRRAASAAVKLVGALHAGPHTLEHLGN